MNYFSLRIQYAALLMLITSKILDRITVADLSLIMQQLTIHSKYTIIFIHYTKNVKTTTTKKIS